MIAAIVGLDTRATMNMDATIKGFPVNEDTVRDMLRNMPDTLNDGVAFSFKNIEEIREGDEYTAN